MEKEKIDVKTTLQFKDAVSYLEDLTKSFKSGTIVIESGENSVAMKPGEQIAIKVEAKRKKNKQKIGFEISWSDTENDNFKISDQMTAPVPAEIKPAAPPAAVTPASAPANRVEAASPATKEEAKTPATKPKAKAPAKKAATKRKPVKTTSKKSPSSATSAKKDGKS